MNPANEFKGTVLQLQRMSVHDGPGIRTTVFLKGCPLRCGWCHNPESQKTEPELAYHVGKCVGCGLCAKHCPAGALRLQDGKIVRDPGQCILCMKCSEICPSFAMETYGKVMTADEVCAVVEKDIAYYESTGGGVTFSGGEPLLQADFVYAVEKRLHENNVHTAVETSCFGEREKLKRLTEETDLFMVDIKTMAKDLHRQWTGASLLPILRNIALLSEWGARALIRITVVLGVSDSIENVAKTAEFLLRETKFRQVELLRMHKLAQGKYQSLGRQYPADRLEIPTEETMRRLERELLRYGMEVINGQP